MTARFAALESRVNAAAMRHCANAVATIGAAEVAVIFDSAHVEAMGMDATESVVLMRDTDVAANNVASNTALTVRGTAYYVARLQPDGAGLTALVLTKEQT